MRRLPEFADFLLAQESAIVDRWRERSEADRELDIVGRLTRAEFQNNIPAALEDFCKILATGDRTIDVLLKKDVAEHGHHRWKQGFSLRQLIRDWGHFNQVLTETIDQYYQDQGAGQSEDRSTALRRLTEYLTEAASYSVERFDDLRRAEATALLHDLQMTKRQLQEVTQARGALLRQVAHDIRGGLSSVTGVSTYLRATGANPETFNDMLDVLDNGVRSVVDMLSSLLDLSRIEAGAETVHLSSVNVDELLAELARDLSPTAMEKGLSLQFSGCPNAVVQTDPSKLRRIAQNLLNNAICYTDSGEVRLACEMAECNWVLRVEDTGPGVQATSGSAVAKELDDEDSSTPAVDQKARSAYHGEGIGLTIVKQLCTLLDAGISMESEDGVGTRFTIEFPLGYDSAAPASS